MTTQHTPGPWKVKFRKDHSSYISIGDHKTGPHHQFDLMFDGRYATDVANARLIAAAPELLEALIAAKRHLYVDSVEWDAADAAIAKATQPPPA